MSVETPSRIVMHPVAPDGDAILRLSGSMTEMMQTVADRGMLPDGGFAMTTGQETDEGFAITSDRTGELMRSHFANNAQDLAAFDAWAERAQLAAGQLELPASLTESGGSKIITSAEPKLLALNARGELGKVNVLASAASGQDEITLVEKDGQAFTVRTYQNADKTVYQAHLIESGNIQGIGRTDMQLDVVQEEGAAAIKLTALDHDMPIALNLEPTFNTLSESKAAHPRLRGVLKGIRRQQHDTNNGQALDLNAVESAININRDQRATDERAEKDRQRQALLRQEREKTEQEAVSIEQLSAKYPLAGNLFTPGASFLEDYIFDKVLHHHKVNISYGEPNEVLATALKNLTIRKDVGKALRYRLDAWCAADPAQEIEAQFNATTPLEEYFDISDPKYVKHHYSTDSLVHYASTNKRTVANMKVPSGVKTNKYKSPNGPPRPGLPQSLPSKDYVVHLALAMLDGSFDYASEDRLTQDRRHTDSKNRVVIHQSDISQHRTAARLILYGEC